MTRYTTTAATPMRHPRRMGRKTTSKDCSVMGMPSSVVNGVMGERVTKRPMASKNTSQLTPAAWSWMSDASMRGD